MQSGQWKNYARPVIIQRKATKVYTHTLDPAKSRLSVGPNKRSGHRVFTTDDFLYVVGGFNSLSGSGSSTFRDIWILNLLTNEWKQMQLIGRFEDTMASFSLTFVPSLKKFYIYGGTGFPFASNVSSHLYECTLVTEECCRIEKLDVHGEIPPRLYGQSAVCQINYDGSVSLFIIGGTQGFQYDMDIYEFNIKSKKVECKQLGHSLVNDVEGSYRHESFIHENAIYSLGGSNDHVYNSFDAISGFDLRDNKYFVKQTLPDEASDEYPEMRKGHALIKYGNMVYIYGGIHLPNPANTPENILNDIWRLNLDDFRWFKMPTKLPEAVFFHSGAVTSKGQVVTFGGCIASQPESVRTHNVTTYFVDVPNLLWLTTRHVYELNKDLYASASDPFQFSYPFDLIRMIFGQKKKEDEADNDARQTAVNNLAA